MPADAAGLGAALSRPAPRPTMGPRADPARTPSEAPLALTRPPAPARRVPRRAVVLLGLAVALLLATDQAVWLARGDVIAPRVRAELPPVERVSPLATQPVELPRRRVPLGGLTEEAALAALREAVGGEPATAVLRDPIDGRTWRYDVAELGLSEWAPRAARAAHDVGRRGPLGGWLQRQRALLLGHVVAVPPAFDAETARRTLEALAPEVDVAPIPADVVVEDGTVEAREPVPGHQLDVEGTLAALAERADQPASTIDLAVARTAPAVYDTSNVAAALEAIRSGPLEMIDRRGQRFTADQATVASWFALRDVPNAEGVPVPAIVVDRGAIEAWLREHVAPIVEVAPTEGRFERLGGDVEALELPRPGYALDVPTSIDRVIDAAYAVPHLGQLAVETTQPAASNAAARAMLEIFPMAGAVTSLAGMPDGRRAAIERAASRLDGTVIPPGGAFSLRDALGEVSAASGYDPAWLVGPRGWLDQVATTAFRAVLAAGLPIAERHAPTWRSGWHEPPVGLDAAIDALGEGGQAPRDLVVLNDTDGWLAFPVKVDPAGSRLEWTVWSAEEPRQVRLEGPTVAVVPGAAEPLRLAAPGLALGAVVQVGWAREGAEARVARTVIVGSELRQDAWESRYAPAPDVFAEGAGGP